MTGDFHMVSENVKTLRLCRQVEQVISLTLGGECGDDRLQGLTVRAVAPAPGPGQLMVTLQAPPGEMDLVGALECLEQVQGLLRREVARAIHRKKVPRLSFRILPDGMDG